MSELSPSLQRNPDLDSWVRIDDGGTVTLFSGKVELGQGVRTAIARIGAEELDVSLARIRVQTADTAHGPNELLTVGSGSDGGERRGDASGGGGPGVTCSSSRRSIGVGSDELQGRRRHRVSPRSRSPHDVLEAVRRQEVRPCGHRCRGAEAAGRLPSSARPRSVDLAAIVTGTARFVQDLTRPGMLYGRVVRRRARRLGSNRSMRPVPAPFRVSSPWCATAASSARWLSGRSRR
jgi:hypothetical protein